MLTAAIVLTLVGFLGAFDIVYFHHYRCRLSTRTESRAEAWTHVLRGFAYSVQFLLVPNLTVTGAYRWAVLLFFVVDISIALVDVALEKRSRASLGGLPSGEYVMHIVLSVLVGVYLHAYLSSTWGGWADPAQISWSPHPEVPEALRALMAVMAIGSGACALGELRQLMKRARPRPLHVRTIVRTTLRTLWDLTQDHRRHPEWDHRFTRITMLRTPIKTGTEMLYEKRILGMTIHGVGRYKLHAPYKQSSFEFWSDDWRSLIRRGVGLWRYVDLGDGRVEFRTSYTYDVRWGTAGRLIDALIFRPLMQAETERSFRRLVASYFPEQSARVAGRTGRKIAKLALA